MYNSLSNPSEGKDRASKALNKVFSLACRHTAEKVLSPFSVGIINRIREENARAVKPETFKVDLSNYLLLFVDRCEYVLYMLLQRRSVALSSSTFHSLP